MEEELQTLLRVTICVLVSQTYCYTLLTKLPKGLTRLLSVLPIISLFIILPFQFSLIHLRAISAFFLTWLSCFKLLLLCFNTGPLSHPQTQQSFLNFILISSLPIKPKDQSSQNLRNAKSISSSPIKPKNQSSPDLRNPKSSLPQPSLNLKTLLIIAVKLSLLVLVIHLYKFKHSFHPKILLSLYCIHMFLMLEVLLLTGAVVVRTLVGLDLEPQFNKPYLSTSLQDFWGRRWNLIVTNILRPMVYLPVRRIFDGAGRNRLSLLPAVIATFLVSGLMHEVMFYYITLAKPSWEVTWFFLLHGFSTAGEIAVKRYFPARFRLHPVVSLGLTFGYLLITGFWLFFPPITRYGSDLQVLAELDILREYLTDKVRSLQLGFSVKLFN